MRRKDKEKGSFCDATIRNQYGEEQKSISTPYLWMHLRFQSPYPGIGEWEWSIDIRKLLAALLIAAVVAPRAAHAYKCDFLPLAPAPGWISKEPAEGDNLVGIGSAEKSETSARQMDSSLNNAIANAAKKVSVTLKNQQIATGARQSGPLEPAEIYKKGAASVVLIFAKVGEGAFSSGTGFFIGKDVVITNAHVIVDPQNKPFSEFTVYLKPERVTGDMENDLRHNYSATLIKFDLRLDVALLRVEHLSGAEAVAELGDSDNVEIGDKVVAIGHPEQGGLWTLTSGTISTRIKDFSNMTGKDMFQTDASTNRGNSGGPLFDSSGAVIGMNTSAARTSNTGAAITGVNFSLQSNVIKKWLAENYPSLSDNSSKADWSKTDKKETLKIFVDEGGAERYRGVVVKGRWLDRDSCTFWTLITVPKEAVLSNKRLATVKALYAASKKAGATDALEMLTEAKALLERVEPRYIQDMNERARYESMVLKSADSLREDIGKRRVLLLTVIRKNSDNITIPASVPKRISSGILGLFPESANMADAGCANDRQCMEVAGNSGAEKLILVNIEAGCKENQLGSFKGVLTVEVNEYNVKSRTRTKTFVAKSEVLSPFAKEDLDWNFAAQKLIESGKLAELSGSPRP